MTHRRIEDYALVGNCKTAALISRDGSIDWLCWPRFDSGACFAALLGEPEHGRWLIAPKEPRASVSRRYLDGSLILVTTFETATGAVELVDWLEPPQAARRQAPSKTAIASRAADQPADVNSLGWVRLIAAPR